MTYQMLEAMQNNSLENSASNYIATGTDYDEAKQVAEQQGVDLIDESGSADDLSVFRGRGYTEPDV